jgi:Domain of unknown function (DUF4153)
MRFPSLHSLAGEAWRTFRRFPIAILLAAKATGLGIWWTHLEYNHALKYVDVYARKPESLQWYWNAIVSCYLGVLLSVAAAKWVEKRRAGVGTAGGLDAGDVGGGRALAIGPQVVVVLLAGLYYWSLPAEVSAIMVIRTVVLALGLHWLIAVAGFGRQEVNGFWIFNKRLFLRGLTAYLYSIVLYIGVALALLAIDKLFNADVHSEVYEDCWWLFGGLFSVWFFLAGFPRSYENPEVISDYPRGLKIFTQYVLLTLVTVYMLILYAYMLKIILTRHWPVGWVAWMVLAFAVAGILSLLLIYPLQNDKSHIWVRNYTRIFYLALLPLNIMLFTSIYKRVGPYGITEQRYFLLALAWWLLFITVYFLVSRRKDIRLVPLSLCILAFLSVWGPWGAFSVSLNSQRGRLKELLEKNKLLVNGKVGPEGAGTRVRGKDRKAISSVTEYIVDIHGYRALQPFFAVNLDSLIRQDSLANNWQSYQRTQEIVHLMGVEYVSRWQTADESDTGNDVKLEAVEEFNISAREENEAIATEGAQYVVAFSSLWSAEGNCDSVLMGPGSVKICADTAGTSLSVTWEPGGDVAIVDLRPLASWVLSKSNDRYDASQKEMTVYFTSGRLSGKVVFRALKAGRSAGKPRFKMFRGSLLISKK